MRRVDARDAPRRAGRRAPARRLEELVLLVSSPAAHGGGLAAGSLTEVRPTAAHTLRLTGRQDQARAGSASPCSTARRRWRPPSARSRRAAPRADADLTERQRLGAYQSWLGRALAKHAVLRQAGRVHALRAIYACMCARLFEWDDDYSPAFVAMRVLGHASLGESLVYTPYLLGADFDNEPTLGKQTLADVC